MPGPFCLAIIWWGLIPAEVTTRRVVSRSCTREDTQVLPYEIVSAWTNLRYSRFSFSRSSSGRSVLKSSTPTHLS